MMFRQLIQGFRRLRKATPGALPAAPTEIGSGRSVFRGGLLLPYCGKDRHHGRQIGVDDPRALVSALW